MNTANTYFSQTKTFPAKTSTGDPDTWKWQALAYQGGVWTWKTQFSSNTNFHTKCLRDDSSPPDIVLSGTGNGERDMTIG